MTKEEAYNKIEQTIEEYFEFASLVKRMRESQKKCDRFIYREIKISFDEYLTKEEILNLEDEVDEYLKKMEI